MAAGILLGIKSNLPEDFAKQLRETGTIHVVVVSGYNITLIGKILLAATLFLGKRISLGLSVCGVVVFALMVGADPPVIRAAIMGIIALIGAYLGKPRNVLLALFVSAFIMLLINPMTYSDIGFQLSFLSSFGLIVVDPVLKSWVKKKYTQGIWESFWTTLSAQVMVWPLIAVYFNSISLISPLVNTLVLETVPVIMLLSTVQIIAYPIFRVLSRVITIPLWIILTYFIEVVRWSSRLPATAITLQGIPLFLIIFYYYLVAVFVYYGDRRRLRQEPASLNL